MVDITDRIRDVGIHGVSELENLLLPLLLTVEGAESGAADYRGGVARELVLGKKITNLFLNEVKELLIVNHVALVQENDDIRNTYLTSKEDVLTGLGHRTIGSSNYEDSAIHLSSTGDHVLDVVSVARAVNVSVVTLGGIVLNVGGVDGDTTSLLLRSVVDLIELKSLAYTVVLSKNGGDCRGKSGLTVIDVSNGSNVDVHAVTYKLFLLCHFYSSNVNKGCLLAQATQKLLRSTLFNNCLGNRRRSLGVMAELHYIGRTALGK